MLVKLSTNVSDRTLFKGLDQAVFIGPSRSLLESIEKLEFQINEQLPWGWKIVDWEEIENGVELVVQHRDENGKRNYDYLLAQELRGGENYV